MSDKTIITFVAEDGPVTVEVMTGNQTAGKYSISVSDGGPYEMVGKGYLGDGIPDSFLIRYHGDDLVRRGMFILGTYASAETHGGKVKVSYIFCQNAEEIGRAEIDESSNKAKIYTNLIIFKKRG